MFEIEKPIYVNKTFRIEKEFLEELEKVAQQNKISVNSLVIQCCKYALSHMDNPTSDRKS
jgi:predicted HicB family RNase H-like nuclease